MIPGIFAGAMGQPGGGGGDVEFRSSDGAAVSGNSISVPVPSGVANGDFLVFGFMCGNQTLTVTEPSGLTSVLADSSSASVVRLYCRTASSEPASYTWGISGTNRLAGFALSYTGASSVDVVGALNRPSGSAICLSINQPSDGVLIAVSGVENSAATSTPTPPSGMELRQYSGAAFGHISASDLIPSGTGASGDKAYTWPSYSSPFGVLLHIK